MRFQNRTNRDAFFTLRRSVIGGGRTRCLADRKTGVAFALVFLSLLCRDSWHAAWSQELDPRLANYDPSGQIRIENVAQAEERRDKLVRFIWSKGLPTTRPKVEEKLADVEHFAKFRQSLISRIDSYKVNVSSMDFHSLVYVVQPVPGKSVVPRLAIVHAGHMRPEKERYLESGLKETIELLLEKGCVVAVMQMPLVAWNQDSSGVLPNGTAFQIEKRGSAGHDEMFRTLEPTLGGQTMAFFLEPIVQVTNELMARHPENLGLLMIGLSGGGWTTHFSAALDPRIDVSIPVAGALPLYARPHSKGSKGDAEQEYAPILEETDTNQDGILDRATGVCSWLEIFALGAVSPKEKRSRKQVQVLNFDDSCCFGGPVYQTYSEFLTKRTEMIGTGRWRVFIDRSHKDHLISEKVLQEVLAPMIIQTVSNP